MPFKPKVDDQGNLIEKDGNVVVLNEKNEEVVFYPHSSLSDLHAEAAKHRHAAKDLKKQLERFEGIDLDEIKELKAFKDNHKDAKEQIEAIKAQITKTYEEQLNEKEALLGDKDGVIRKLSVSNKFASSEYIAKETILPPKIAEAYFGSCFEVQEDGSLVPMLNGKEIYSPTKVGELASFDEAMKQIVEASDFRDSILRDNGHSGSGVKPGDQSRSSGVVNPWKRETRNLTQQSKIMAENPTLGAKLKAEAGIK